MASISAIWDSFSKEGNKLSVVDTMVLGSAEGNKFKPLLLVFTDAKGSLVVRKKVSWTKVRDNFIKLSGNEPVCRMVMSNGSVHLLDETTFAALMAGGKRDGCLSSVVLLQACPPSSSEFKTMFDRINGCETHVIKGQVDNFVGVEMALDGIVRQLANIMETSLKTKVISFQASFSSSSEGILRVFEIVNLKVSESKVKKEPLPSLGSKSDRRLGLTSPHQKCHGDFCGLQADNDLNSLNILNLENTSNLSQVNSFTEYERVRTSSASVSKRSALKDLTRIGQRELLLARPQMHFITGGIRQTDSDLRDDADFGRAWKQLDSQLEFDLAKKHPELFYQDTTVCSNCLAVYSRIESLRKADFQTSECPITPQAHQISPRNDLVRSAPSFSDQKYILNNLQVKEETKKEESHPLSKKTRNRSEKKTKTIPYSDNKIKKKKNTAVEIHKPTPSFAETEYLMRHAEQLRAEQHTRDLELAKEKLSEETELLKSQNEFQSAEIRNMQISLDQFKKEAHLKTQTVQVLEQKLGTAQNVLSQSQSSFLKAMKEKEDECDRLNLEVDQIKHSLLALQSQQNTPDELADQLTQTAVSQQQMKTQIETLQLQLVNLESEKRRISSLAEQEKLDAGKALQSRLQDEVLSFNKTIAELEESNEQKQIRLREAADSMNVFKTQENDLRDQLSRMSSEKYRIQDELVTATQSLKSLTSLGNTEDAAITAVRLTCEAQVKQFKHQLDFMEKQAQSEAICVEELKTALLETRQEINQLAIAHKQELISMEQSRKRETQERELVFEKELEVPRSQVRLLEEKFHSLQNEMQKINNETSMLRRKLQVSEQDYRRAKEENNRLLEDKNALEHNMAELQSTLNQAQNITAGDVTQEAKLIMDATTSADIRKLENKMSFLQQQLDVEVHIKEDLSKAVETSRAQLKQTLKEWKDDASNKEALYQEELALTQSTQGDLRQEQIRNDVKLKSAIQELDQLKEAHTKTKDRLVYDQDVMQASVHKIEELKQNLASKSTLLETRTVELQNIKESSKRTIDELTSSISRMEVERERAVRELKQKLTETHKDLSRINESMLHMKDVSAMELNRSQQSRATTMLFSVFCNKQQLSIQRAFGRLAENKSVFEVVDATQEDLAYIREQHQRDMAARLSQVTEVTRQQVEHELQDLVISSKEEAARIAEEGSSMAYEELLVRCAFNREMIQHSSNTAMAHEKEKHLKVMTALEKESHVKLHKLQAANLAEKQVSLRQAENEKLAAIESASKEFQAKMATEIQRVQNLYEVQIATLHESHLKEISKVKSDYELDNKTALDSFMEMTKKDTQAAFQVLEQEKLAEIAKLKIDLESEFKAAFENTNIHIQLNHDAALSKIQQDHQIELAECIQKVTQEVSEKVLHASTETELELSQLHDSKLAEYEIRVANMMNKHREEMEAVQIQSSNSLKELETQIREEEKIERTNALKHSTEKWQKVLQECSDEGLKEQEKLVTDAAKSKSKYVRQERERFEREIEERDKAACKAHQTELESLKVCAKADIDDLRERLQAEFKTELQAKLEVAAKESETALIRVEAEYERLIQVQKKRSSDEKQAALAKVSHDHELALTSCASESISQLESHVIRVRKEEALKYEKALEQIEKRRLESEQDLLRECDEAMQRKLAEAQFRLQDAVMKCRDQCEARYNEELCKVRLERDQVMDDSEHALKQQREEHDRLENDYSKLQDTAEESEDAVFDLEQTVKRLKQSGAIQRFAAKLNTAKTFAAFCNFREKLQNDMKTEFERAQLHLAKDMHLLKTQLNRADEKIEAFQSIQNTMSNVLMNYKKKDLMEYKVQSSLLNDELSKLASNRDGLEKQRQETSRDISQLEGQVKEVERQIQEASKVSAIQDGKINVGHAKRKKLLDTEFEHLLDRAAHKKGHLELLDNKIDMISEHVMQKDDMLKSLEAKLVQILVEQQKQLALALK